MCAPLDDIPSFEFPQFFSRFPDLIHRTINGKPRENGQPVACPAQGGGAE